MYEPIRDKGEGSTALTRRTKILVFVTVIVLVAVAISITTWLIVRKEDHHNKCILPEVADNPPAPLPERVVIVSVPLPPTAPSNDTGACSLTINPHETGCMDPGNLAMQSGSFSPDGNHIVATITFSGAPAAPSPASIYSGLQVILIKVDGTLFPNGDAWKCLTCGVPPSNAQGVQMGALDYPQTFHDGMRVLASTNIISCSPYLLSDPLCSPNATFIYPLHWPTSADGSGSGGSMRELRLHPDNDYIGFNSMVFTASSTDQFAYIGRLAFNPHPINGTPLVPRYDITYVTLLYNPSSQFQPISLNPSNSSEIIFSPLAPMIGEFRGWSNDGTEALWIGLPVESCNYDIMATSLANSTTRRLTSNPGYTDPVDMSPYDEWIVVMDTRVSERMTFAAGMRGIPPIIDLATSTVVASIRNNGDRRFFEPILIDKYGDRGEYQGQLLTAEGDGSPGSINDPNWNGMADPRWSPNGTSVVFWQAMVTPPACGGENPLPCPNSTEPGQRRSRIFIAQFPDRKAAPPLAIPSVPDTIPWGTPFPPGSPAPSRYRFPVGNFTLYGNKSGSAQIQITYNLTSTTSLLSVSANYSNYSDDGYFIINGEESAIRNSSSPIIVEVFWKSSLTLSGCQQGSKETSPEGYRVTLNLWNPIVQSTGFLATTIGNTTYSSPSPGT